jgi:23S rRNA pseudouridine2605 synthase
MLEGVRMGDGMVQPTKIEFVGQDPHQVGVEIKTGRNRAVRGLFEQFGYTITKLDRVKIGGLSKKDLPRGHYRHLTEQEVQFLAMIR